MSQTGHMRSIARRISNSFLLRYIFLLLLINLLLVASGLGYIAYSTEKAVLGASWQANLTRDISSQEGTRGREWIGSLRYSFGLPGQQLHTSQPGPMILAAYPFILSLQAGQALLVFLSYRGFRRRTLYLLTPLREMAQTAQQLSSLRFDEQRFHHLEDAIENLPVQSPQARLSTGDSELSGLEEAVNKLISRMHEAYRQQGRFVSDASHELRTPIAVIRGYADLLARWGKEDVKVREEAIAAIRNEADSMQRLVEQLLFLARGEAGRSGFEEKKIDLALLVSEAYEEYRLIDADHVWRIRTQGPLPVVGDEALLKQALRILADNAIKFSPPGSAITLGTANSEQGQPGFFVQDNGTGIAAADLPHIFDRFYRADPARARGGTGLGLSIAYWIAQRHSGHIEVYSSEGLGTRFTFLLGPVSG